MALNINGTTGISGVDGSASAASVAGTDANTGLSFASDTVNINTGGTTRVTVDSSGNLNIPTDNTKLQIGASQDLFLFHNGGTGNSNISNKTGDLFIQGNNGSGTAVNQIAVKSNAAVELNYQGNKKLETTSTGVITSSILTVQATEGVSANLHLIADDGDDNGDGWRINSNQDANDLTLANDTSGSYADKLTLTKEGNISVSGSGLSDRDLKDNIATVTTTALDKIKQLVPKTFTWKKYDNNRTFTGFIAQDVESVLPILVNGTDGEKNMSLDYNGVLAYAVKAITELSAEVETLKTKVAALEAG